MIFLNNFLTTVVLVSCFANANPLTLNSDEVIAIKVTINDLAKWGISILDYKSIIESNEKTIKITLIKDDQLIEMQGGGNMELTYIISKRSNKIIFFKKTFGK